MTWIFGPRRRQRERIERERDLARAEWEVARIRERAERVAEPLRERLKRNHWGESAAAIVRREP